MKCHLNDFYVKGKKIFIVYDHDEPEYTKMYAKTFDKNTGECISTEVIPNGCVQNKVWDKVKCYNDGIYVLESSKIKRYNLAGNKLLDTYVLPKGKGYIYEYVKGRQ